MKKSKLFHGKPVSQMTDGEIVRLHNRRVLIFSWVAFLEQDGKKTVDAYYNHAMKSMAEVDREIVNREIKISCH